MHGSIRAPLQGHGGRARDELVEAVLRMRFCVRIRDLAPVKMGRPDAYSVDFGGLAIGAGPAEHVINPRGIDPQRMSDLKLLAASRPLPR